MKNIRKTIIWGMIIASAGLVSLKTFANAKRELTFLDNHFVQTYAGRDGIWMIPQDYKKSPLELLEETGAGVEEFLSINGIPNIQKIPKSLPLFFPYGEKQIQSLEEDGKFRESVNSEPDKLVWPVLMDKHSKITSRIGRRWNKFHTGIDIACVRGSLVLAAADGEVLESGWMGHYGKVIKLYHPQVSNTETLYAHNHVLLVKKGDKVKKGQLIAYSGNTGKSTGPHLHFEVRYQNIFLNPEHFLPEFPDLQETLVQLD